MPQPSANQDVQPSLSAQVFERLRSDIIGCRLQPDARLRLEELRERYGAGASPIREALMRLEVEGLVILEQNRGFRVSPISQAHLVDLTANRIEIEGLALRWAMERGGVEWEAEILGAFHRLSRQSKSEAGEQGRISEAWKREHRAFHRALVAGCGSPMLMSIRETLFDQGERYVALSIVRSAPPRDDVGEHKRIMDAVIARDLDKALAANRQHIERTTEKVLATIQVLAA
ncbi:DNA-binding transcriptional regulator, GntR family [Rhizobiales bacterium GAS188]|nr:DNA-binding transcriptional regulator, GntR family [Rhizobiales bacterium GAS188]